MTIRAVLLDIDGVLVLSWRALPGAAEAVATLRRAGLALRFLTNTTSRTSAAIGDALRDAGVDVANDEITTAARATAAHLARHHSGQRVLLLDDGPTDDLQGIALVGPDDEADVVVLGGAGPSFGWATLNDLAARVADGAHFVAMHGSAVWQTDDGLCLDTGAFAAAIEAATGIAATVIGKPAPTMFEHALTALGCEAGEAMMVGDDVRTDVLAAQAVGMTGVLVRTGKFRPGLLATAGGDPDHVVDSIADVPALLSRLPSR